MANLKVYCNNPNLKTITEIATFFKIKTKKSGNYTELFEYNRDWIFKQLSQDFIVNLAKLKGVDVDDLSSSDIDINVPLPCPCYIFVPEKDVSYSLIAKNTNLQIPEVSAIAYEDKIIRNTLNSGYTENRAGARYKPGCRVIGWFKTYYYTNKNSDNSNHEISNLFNQTQNFVDLSPIVMSLNTSVGEQGGNFSITFPHIPLRNPSINAMNALFNLIYSAKNNMIQQSQELYEKMGCGELNIKDTMDTMDFLEYLIQPNDLFFISFDDMEDLNNDNLSDYNYDMIGLVDTVSVSRNANGNITVDVTGRDLMKLIMEDASLFYPTGVTAGNPTVFNNTETVLQGGDIEAGVSYKAGDYFNGATRQITGSINIFAQEPNGFNIDFVLKTVISHLANMQVVPDDLFTNWGDKRTKFSTLKPKNR